MLWRTVYNLQHGEDGRWLICLAGRVSASCVPCQIEPLTKGAVSASWLKSCLKGTLTQNFAVNAVCWTSGLSVLFNHLTPIIVEGHITWINVARKILKSWNLCTQTLRQKLQKVVRARSFLFLACQTALIGRQRPSQNASIGSHGNSNRCVGWRKEKKEEVKKRNETH